VHHEGSTTGTDLQSGFKQHQILNVPKFQEKWKNELTHQHKKSSENLYHARNRANGKRMLIIDDWPPLPDRSSGTLRLYLTVKLLCKLGYQVTFGFLVKQNLLETGSKYIKELQALGVEFVWLEYDLWGEYRNTPEVKRVQIGLIKTLELKKRNYDHIYICFWFIASYFIDFIREEVPDTPIIIDTEDLHYLREKRQAQIQNSKELEKTAEITKKNELAVYAKADAVTTVTAEDRAILMQDLQSTPVFLITNIHEPMPTKAGFDQRRDFLFVGNFNHTPNENGVLWFVKEIFPLIHQQLPDAKAYIVGNNPTPKIKALHSDSIIVTGWVPEVKPYLEQCRVSVVPLLYGAGMKGKVGETLANGLPMVSTSIGAEGMNIVHGEHAFIADDPQQFAALAVELYSKKNVWERMSHDGKELMAGQYSEKKVSKRFEYLLSFDRQGFQSYRAFAYPDPPKVSIVIPVFNQWEFTKQCLESIKTHTSISHEIIAVDNASSDETIKALHKYPEVRLIQNERNVGFPGAINQGIAAAIGEHVLLLNNDTIVTDGWLERMVEILESHSGIGIVGPVSNKVSGVQLDKEAGYTTIQEMHLYAAKKSQERKGSVLEFPRIAFLCTLIKRSLLDNIGGLDERFAPGNYEDDDYCLRANLAGYKTLVTQDVFVHHFGSKSFLENGENAYVQRLQTNRNKFKEKWGSDADDVWLHKAQVKKRNLHIHVQQDPFIQAFERASVLLEDREIALALNYLKEAIAIYHQSPRRQYTVEYTQVLTLAGNVALMAGNLELARQYFEEELNLTPSSLQACLGLARVFKMAGIVDASKTMYKAALQLDPQNNAAQAELTELAETAISTEVEAI
jgi:GT2 family glycosyltransferase/glycosyltransferase involved in cell wall biosynthesis